MYRLTFSFDTSPDRVLDLGCLTWPELVGTIEEHDEDYLWKLDGLTVDSLWSFTVADGIYTITKED